MPFREIKVYECPECDTLVRDGDICCEPEVFDGFQCENCDEIYEDKPPEKCEACDTP
jgi:hypothetical protein